MAQAAPQRSPLGTPVSVTVQDGTPSQTSVSIATGGQVQFTNLDNSDYLLELWMKGNEKHAAVCVLLPAAGSVTLQGDPSDRNDTCHYNILTTSGGQTNPTAGGNYNIIIGSGDPEAEGS